LGWLTGIDDDGVHDLVGESLALGAVPDWEQPAEVAGRAVEQVREQAEERSSRPEGPARPLVDQPGPGDLFAPALPGATLPEGAVPEPGGRERIALQLRILDNGGNPRRTNEVVMSGHHLTTHLRRRATARRFCDVSVVNDPVPVGRSARRQVGSYNPTPVRAQRQHACTKTTRRNSSA